MKPTLLLCMAIFLASTFAKGQFVTRTFIFQVKQQYLFSPPIDPLPYAPWKVSYFDVNEERQVITGITDSNGWDTVTISGIWTRNYVTVSAEGNCPLSGRKNYTGSSVNTKKTGDTVSLVISPYCGEVTKCEAKFYMDTAKTTKWNMYIREVSHTYAGTLSYEWDFGDGATSNLKHPSHEYASLGTYNLCLYLTASLGDSATGDLTTIGIDTLCKQLTVDSTGASFKRGVYRINIIGEDDDVVGVINNEPMEIKAYPNPANDKLFIKSTIDLNGFVAFYDLSGKLLSKGLLSQKESESTSFDLSTFSAGMLLVKIHTDNGVYSDLILISK